MKSKLLLSAVIAGTFGLGAAFGAIGTRLFQKQPAGRATGIGGIFFKAEDPKALRAWYEKNLGILTNQYGAVFEWYQGADSTQKGFLQWSPFSAKTKYFAPSTKEFMINYRVQNLDGLLKNLRAAGVTVTDTVQSETYGKFVHIMDPEGNKLELWEPNDKEFEKLGIQIGATTNK